MLRVMRRKKRVDIYTNATLGKPKLEIIVWDKNGKIIERKKVKAGSYLKNFALYLKGMIHGEGETVVSTGGTSVTVHTIDLESHYYNDYSETHTLTFNLLNINSGAGVDSYGIVVGNGTTAVSSTDYKLESQIANGTGSSQLSYDAHSFSTITVGGGVSQFSVARSFSNNSGANISVSEAGVVIYHRFYVYDYSATIYDETQYILIVRDVFSSVSVPDGGGLTVKYTFTIDSDFTEWFAYMLYAFMKGGDQTITDTSGASATAKGYYSNSHDRYYRYTAPVEHLYLLSGDDDTSFGIVVGTGTTAFDQSQNALTSQIAQGTGSGQLDYQTHTTYDLEDLTDKYRIKTTRTFYNGSGASITVNEIGLYVYERIYMKDADGTWIDITTKWMAARKVVSQAVDADATLNIHWYVAIPK